MQLRASARAAIQRIYFKHIINDGDGCPVMRTNVQDMADRGIKKCGYLIVAFTVMTDVPEAVGPLPVALMAKLSLPLYLAFAVYW